MDKALVSVPPSLPLLTVNPVVLPGSSVRLSVETVRGMNMVKHIVQRSSLTSIVFGVVGSDVEEMENKVGTAVMCSQIMATNWPHPRYNLLVTGLCRIRIDSVTQSDPYIVGKVTQLELEPGDTSGGVASDSEFNKLSNQLQETTRQFLRLVDHLNIPEIVKLRRLLDEAPAEQTPDIIVSLLQASDDEKRDILETLDPKQRFQKAIPIIEERISRLMQRQKEGRGRQIIRRREGPGGSRAFAGPEEVEDELSELQQRLNGLQMSPEAAKTAEREMKRLKQMPASMPEYAMLKNYLEFMADLPWQSVTEDRLNVKEARVVLDEDHHSLEKPKRRILEYLAVRQLKNSLKGPIICLVGPPGVGKTSIGRSVARCLGRKFFRMSLGGVCDQSDIRGHRRTYIGAMPGRVLSGLKATGARNPVFLLDEIDKLGKSLQGDPAAALLEVLDPEQNCTFVDHYLNVPFDLSQVLFIATANSVSGIPPALLDRMEMIQIAGYTEEEKIRIAEDHLIPKQVKEHGLSDKEIGIPTGTLCELISSYTHEAGVRTLERRIGALCRAVAIRVAESGDSEANSDSAAIPALPVVIDSAALRDILGPPRASPELPPTGDEIRPGVALGLAWTPVGGALMYVEASKLLGEAEDKLVLTGQLGKVMKESATLARTWVRSNSLILGLDVVSCRDGGLHLHFPEGATSKDGPSAGVAIITALVSLLLNRPARSDTAMTGEITLRGLVLPVGGIKEKLLAAVRAGVKRVIVPRKNKIDVEEIPKSAQKALTIIYASTIEDVVREAFPMMTTLSERPLALRSKI